MRKRLYCLLIISAVFLLSACAESIPSQINLKPTEDELSAPEDFAAHQQNQSNVLTWKQDSGLSYTIYWSTDPEVSLSGSQRIDDAKSPQTHKNLTNGTTYYYVIQASKESKIGLSSSTKSATPSDSAALSRPENLLLESSNGEITLNWNRVSGADIYKVYWTTIADENPIFSTNAPIETQVNFYAHRNLENNVKYFYVITAIAADGESEPTEKKWASPGFLVPGIPSNLNILEFGSKSVKIEWDLAENSEQYKIYWSTAKAEFDLSSASFSLVSAGGKEFSLNSLIRGNTYYIKIAGLNDGGEGAASKTLIVDFSVDTGSIDPSIIPPFNIEVSVVGITASIKWQTENTRYSYKVYYATEPNINIDNINLMENSGESGFRNRPSYNMDNLNVGRTYYVVVIAILGNKESTLSEEISFSIKISDAFYEKSDIEKGAKLYSQWWPGFKPPNIENPLWQDAAQNNQGDPVNSAQTADTWRCAECHGWDFRGRDGEYGIGSKHFTNFPGLLDAANNKTREEIYSFIRSGKTSNNRLHSFKLFSQQNALDLTRFIMSEVPKDLSVWGGNASIGEAVFTQKNSLGNACEDSNCHKDLPTLESEKKILLDSALAEPARFIHYTRYGVGIMPGGQSLDSARDALAYLWQHSLDDTAVEFQTSTFEKTDIALYDQWAQGGVLYDRWWDAILTDKSPPPTGNHPLWPAIGTVINGTDTWRCKECHGWDYRGKDGVYGRGKHFTGIIGILDSATAKQKTAKEIFNFLRIGDKHAYTFYLADEDIYALTRLIVELRKEADIQQAPNNLINKSMQEPEVFSASLGESSYQDSIEFGGCIACHIVNDTRWFFSDSDPERDALQTLDGIAKQNPWEFLHKIRFGHPGSIMKGIIQYGSITPESAINILGYVQTALAPNIKHGGRLYDNWWLENEFIRPKEPHVLWPSDIVDVRADNTWRCVNCHGWDYQGKLGIKGVVDLTRETLAFIENGTYLNSNDHSFNNILKRQDLHDLTAFITNAENTGVRSDIDLLLASADAITGKSYYLNTTPGNCINCHGENGTSIPNIDLETAANNSAALFIHKARFGSPNSIMVPGLDRFKGLTAQQAVDVHAYAKDIANVSSVNAAGLDRGGRLFDNWFKEMKAADAMVEDPVIVNPLWEARKTGIPELQSLSDSWRCVSCHNWNYKGIDLLTTDADADNLLVKLALRQGSFPTQIELADYFYGWIKEGSGGLHNYGAADSGLPTVLGDRELKELSAFITQGIIDTSEVIYNIDGKVINGDVSIGQDLYTGKLLKDVNCSTCHGDSGENIPPGGDFAVDIFALAKENPWQFLHKVRFASSGTAMPALIGLPGTNLQHALNVLSYAQAEFAKRP